MADNRFGTKEERVKRVVEFFRTMEAFSDVDSIPSPPILDASVYKKEIIPNYIRCGAVPKSGLKDGVVYEGLCRNASEATWNAKQNKFVYERHKFGSSYEETINHFEDDDGYDLFVPLKEKTENPN